MNSEDERKLEIAEKIGKLVNVPTSTMRYTVKVDYNDPLIIQANADYDPVHRRCACNGCEMIYHEGEWWCPHMEDPEDVNIERHIEWQEANNIPEFLCKYTHATNASNRDQSVD